MFLNTYVLRRAFSRYFSALSQNETFLKEKYSKCHISIGVYYSTQFYHIHASEDEKKTLVCHFTSVIKINLTQKSCKFMIKTNISMYIFPQYPQVNSMLVQQGYK